MGNNKITYELRKTYVANLLGNIEDIANEEHHQKVWVEAINPDIVDSWEETMCRFFDDCNIDHFLREEEQGSGPQAYSFTHKQTEELQKLRDVLDIYSEKKFAECDPPESYSDPQEIINDPEWHQCVEQAKITLKAFEGYEVPKDPVT